MTPAQFVRAARVHEQCRAQIVGEHGPWEIFVQEFPEGSLAARAVGFPTMTVLARHTDATLMHEHGETVMEDSCRELARHLPIWLNAKGTVLVTGLGLGCVVRGLLANPNVDEITVIEKCRHILRAIGPEFIGNPRVRIYQGDALEFEPASGETWSYAWHDIWTDGPRTLQLLHGDLVRKFAPHVRRQGAWLFPREAKRIGRRVGLEIVG